MPVWDKRAVLAKPDWSRLELPSLDVFRTRLEQPETLGGVPTPGRGGTGWVLPTQTILGFWHRLTLNAAQMSMSESCSFPVAAALCAQGDPGELKP